ncbi:MAG: hypothetical protein ABL879_14015 [Devosia sp.]
MRLNSKLSWGLAWAGLALVIAVPSADYLSGKPQTAAVITSDTDVLQTASITPAETAPVAPVVAPRTIELAPPATSSLTLAPMPVATSTPTPVKPAPAITAVEPVAPETKVASIAPAPKMPPFPTPVSERPTLPAEQPASDDSIFIPSDMAMAQPASVGEPMMIEPEGHDDIIVMPSGTRTASTGPRPPAGIQNDPNVSDPESLREFLIQRGLFEDSAVVDVDVSADAEYDPDGYYLNDGPNESNAQVNRQRLDSVQRQDRGSLLDFSLF